MSEVILSDGFFAPASTDLIDNLLGQYKQLRTDIEMMSGIVSTHTASVHHFINGNGLKQGRCMPGVSEVFKVDGAIASLNADFWQKALNLTDVYEYMPQKRRDEWNEQIREMKTPDFEEETARPTIMELLNSRQKFFGERVDGIFQALSGEHVTNRPEGFGKRMIIAGVRNSYDTINYSVAGYIHDLRQVVAKFMGRDEPRHGSTEAMIKQAYRQTGTWLTIDGGALRIRCYLKGTAHFEVHPEMAWRLNCVLASMFPTAIPPEFRQKPKKKLKDFEMILRPLPFVVIAELVALRKAPTGYWGGWSGRDWKAGLTENKNSRQFGQGDFDKFARAEAERVLISIGASKMRQAHSVWFEFDYDPTDVIGEIVASGCIPDQKSHQFYPTPESLALRCIEAAQIGPNHSCLEPSAGLGGIADHLPKEKTTCIEISALNCKVLEEKGHRVVNADFIQWAEHGGCFDRIVMNPPFSEGRALAHVVAAASLSKASSRLVAILPEGMKGKDILPGWDVSWSEPISNEFAGTSISVVILTAEREV